MLVSEYGYSIDIGEEVSQLKHALQCAEASVISQTR